MAKTKQVNKITVNFIKYHLKECIDQDIKCPCLIESIYFKNKKMFLVAEQKHENLSTIKIKNQFETNDKKIIPTSLEDYPYSPYNFSNIDEINKSKIDFTELYERIFSVVSRFIAIEDEWKHFITSCILFTYKQDQSPTTPYVYLVGDNESGKSTILHLMKALAYRPLLSESLPSANIYNFLGTKEEGTGIILEDESQGLEKQFEKLKIYKGGYVKGSRIPRVKDNPSGGSKQVYYFGYCFKVFAGEKLPKDRGILQRCIVIHMVEDYPDANIKDLKPEDLSHLSKLRNDLMLWRLQTAFEKSADIQLGFLKNRDAELWKPILRLLEGTKFFINLERLSFKLVEKKRREKNNTLEAALFTIVSKLNKVSKHVAFEDIWNEITSLPGQDDPINPQGFYLEEHGKVTKTNVGMILSQKFRGEKYRDANKRLYIFDKITIKRLGRKYSPYSLYGYDTTTSELPPIDQKLT